MVVIYGQTLGDFEKALAWGERVKDENLRETLRATCLNLLGRLDDAAAAARRALELDPTNVEATIHLSRALHFQWRLKDSAALCRNAISMDPQDPRAYLI